MHGFSYRHKAKGLCVVWQQSPTFFGPGIGFMEDEFSTGGGGGGGGGGGSGGNGSDGKWQMKLRVLASCSRVLCGLVLNRQRTAQTLGPREWGLLLWWTELWT